MTCCVTAAINFRCLRPASTPTPQSDKGIELEGNYKYLGTFTDSKLWRDHLQEGGVQWFLFFSVEKFSFEHLLRGRPYLTRFHCLCCVCAAVVGVGRFSCVRVCGKGGGLRRGGCL